MALNSSFPGMEFFLRQLIAATGVLKADSSASYRGDNCGLAPRDPAVYASGRQAGGNGVSTRQWVEFGEIIPVWFSRLAGRVSQRLWRHLKVSSERSSTMRRC